MRATTLPMSVIVAIAEAVEKAGGNMADVDHMVQTWERLHRNKRPRVDAMRREAATVRCCCADGGAGPVSADARCSRCLGWPEGVMPGDVT